MTDAMDNMNVVLFDGYCGVCSTAVQVLMKMDPEKKLRFASLQSEYAKKNVLNKIVGEQPDSIIFYSHSRLFVKSDAIFNILKVLGGSLKFFLIFSLFPLFLTDAIYDFIARNRYKIISKKENCYLPTESEKELFIN